MQPECRSVRHYHGRDECQSWRANVANDKGCFTVMNPEERMRLAESIRRASVESEGRLQGLPEKKGGQAMPWALIFMIAAVILFILAAVNVPSSRVNLQAAGLACLTVSLMFGVVPK